MGSGSAPAPSEPKAEPRAECRSSSESKDCIDRQTAKPAPQAAAATEVKAEDATEADWVTGSYSIRRALSSTSWDHHESSHLPDIRVRTQDTEWCNAFEVMGRLHVGGRHRIDLQDVGGIDLGHANFCWALLPHETSQDAKADRCLVLRARRGESFYEKTDRDWKPCTHLQLYMPSASVRTEWLRAYRADLSARGLVAKRLLKTPRRSLMDFTGARSQGPRRIRLGDPEHLKCTSGTLETASISSLAKEFDPQAEEPQMSAVEEDAALYTTLERLAAAHRKDHIEAELVPLHSTHEVPLKVWPYGKNQSSRGCVIDVAHIRRVRLGYAGIPPSAFRNMAATPATCVFVLTLDAFKGASCKFDECDILVRSETPELRMAWLAVFDARLLKEHGKRLVHSADFVAVAPPSLAASTSKVRAWNGSDVVWVAFLSVLLTTIMFALVWEAHHKRQGFHDSVSPPSPTPTSIFQQPVWSSTPHLSVLVRAINASDTRAPEGCAYALHALRPQRDQVLVLATAVLTEEKSSGGRLNDTHALSVRLGQMHAPWPQERTELQTDRPEDALAWLRLRGAEASTTRAFLAAPVHLRHFALTVVFGCEAAAGASPTSAVSYEPHHKSVHLAVKICAEASGASDRLSQCTLTHYLAAAWRTLAFHVRGRQAFKNVPLGAFSCDTDPSAIWSA